MASRADPGGMSLPKPFVDSMRVLFDIMVDDRQRGTVKFAEIQQRWGNSENSENSWSSSLPKGILECLANVTNADNELTFDRFCAGLKICLLKNETNGGSPGPLPPPKPPRLLPDPAPSKRREPRRHTLQNGIDYNRLKRLKQLEQEKTLLKETLLAINETQNWLNQKLHCVHDQIRHVGRSSAPLEMSPVQQQERLDLKRAQISEVQRCLVRLRANLEDKSEFLYELNLETHWNSPERVHRLKQQNQLQQETINRLEAEKMNLVRQLKRF